MLVTWKQTDSAPLAESLTSAAILRTHPCASAKVTFSPRSVSLVVGAICRLSAIFGERLPYQARQLPVPCHSQGGFGSEDCLGGGLLRVAYRDDERARPFWTRVIPYPSSHHLHLLTLSITVLLFLFAVIFAFSADGVVCRHAPQRIPGGSNNQDLDDGYNYVCGRGGCSGKRTRFVIIYQGYTRVSLTISCSNDGSVGFFERVCDTEDEDTSVGEEDISFQVSFGFDIIISSKLLIADVHLQEQRGVRYHSGKRPFFDIHHLITF